jgi:hypothetical protein
MPSLVETYKAPFPEQLDYFRGKLNLPTEHWDDILGVAHDRAFIVAGAAKADLLNDLRLAVDKAIAQGTGLEAFRRDFAKIVQRTGWDYNGSFDWRTRVIYQTNLSASYAAGRWQQLNDPALLKVRPYWKYVHADGVANPRPLHVAWNGITLPAGHTWFKTHFAPNGWGCHCRIVAVSKREYEATPDDRTVAPDDGTYTKVDASGVEHVIPNGIDFGFAHAPGASLTDLVDTIEQKSRTLPPELGTPLAEDCHAIRKFEPQATIKAAEEWARKQNLADFVDYAGIKPDTANAWNHSLFDHLKEFPELRKQQEYCGTTQGQFEHYTQQARQRLVDRLIDIGTDEDSARKIAQARIKKPKAPGNTYAISWAQPGVRGVSINKKWGSDPVTMVKQLERDVSVRWHPTGCSTIRSVVDHEFGHQLDDLLALRKDASIINLYKKAVSDGLENEVSRYAEKSIAEFIAECWAESCNNINARPTARAVAEIVRSRYQSRFSG